MTAPEASDDDEPEGPDGFTYGIRFGCGALLGLVVGSSGALYLFDLDSFWLGGLLLAVVFGVLSAALGDRFWENLRWWV